MVYKPVFFARRRAGTLSNGTSDGDDVQTPETDSQESPDKAEALSRAIQAAGEDNSEQETIVVRTPARLCQIVLLKMRRVNAENNSDESG